jgi:hypothetical protein
MRLTSYIYSGDENFGVFYHRNSKTFTVRSTLVNDVIIAARRVDRSGELIKALEEFRDGFDVPERYKLLECKSFANSYSNMFHMICPGALNGFSAMSTGLFSITIFMTIGLVLILFAFRKYGKKDVVSNLKNEFGMSGPQDMGAVNVVNDMGDTKNIYY